MAQEKFQLLLSSPMFAKALEVTGLQVCQLDVFCTFLEAMQEENTRLKFSDVWADKVKYIVRSSESLCMRSCNEGNIQFYFSSQLSVTQFGCTRIIVFIKAMNRFALVCRDRKTTGFPNPKWRNPQAVAFNGDPSETDAKIWWQRSCPKWSWNPSHVGLRLGCTGKSLSSLAQWWRAANEECVPACNRVRMALC